MCGCRDTTNTCTRDSLVSKDTKVYQLALLFTTLADVLAGVFAQILTFVVAITGFAPDLQLYTALIKAGQLLGLLGFTVLKRLYVSTAALSLFW